MLVLYFLLHALFHLVDGRGKGRILVASKGSIPIVILDLFWCHSIKFATLNEDFEKAGIRRLPVPVADLPISIELDLFELNGTVPLPLLFALIACCLFE